jgi:ssRNA-specific RNase YbeY (16S rRNA maturation enzyme)
MLSLLHSDMFQKVDDFAIDIWFCSDSKIRELNREWRQKMKSTDILSFPINDVSDYIQMIHYIYKSCYPYILYHYYFIVH